MYLDMDLMVTDPTVDFAKNYVGGAYDLVLTDHNRVLNNGAPFGFPNFKFGPTHLALNLAYKCH